MVGKAHTVPICSSASIINSDSLHPRDDLQPAPLFHVLAEGDERPGAARDWLSAQTRHRIPLTVSSLPCHVAIIDREIRPATEENWPPPLKKRLVLVWGQRAVDNGRYH